MGFGIRSKKIEKYTKKVYYYNGGWDLKWEKIVPQFSITIQFFNNIIWIYLIEADRSKCILYNDAIDAN